MMQRYSVSGISYEGALSMIEALRADKIEAAIDAGGVALYPLDE